jgi:hypothetical protein
LDITTYQALKNTTEEYHRVKVSSLQFTDTQLQVSGVGDFDTSDDLFTTLSRFVSVPKGLNQNLRKLDKTLWEQMIRKLYELHYEDQLVLKLQDGKLFGISNFEKDPVGNVKFLDRIISYFEDLVGIEVEEINYNPALQNCSAIVLNTAEHDYQGEKYRLGVVIENDSLYGANVRLAIKKVSDSTYIYATPNVFSLSSARYNRTTDTGFESLNAMLITVSDGLRSDLFTSTLVDRLNEKLYAEENTKITYEEFYRTRLAIVRYATVSQFDEDTVKKMVEVFRDLFDFYKNYESVLESDYIWKTTAYSDQPISVARQHLSTLANNVSMTYESVRDLRSFAGELLFGKHLFGSLAIRK